MIFDLDEFKEINDTYGHQAGDEALIQIGKLLLSKTRKPDILARYGGEEFIVLMPETKPTGAQIFAERLRQLVEDSPLQYKNELISLTISAGVSGKSYNNSGETLDGVISQADQAMYKAKNIGKNQVVRHPEESMGDDQKPSAG
jgi:diguanylate cyclase (GGDEF)-like protein